MDKLLKFRYIFIFSVFLNCGNEPKTNSSLPDAKNGNQQQETTNNKETSTILFFGNSLTAAYGLDPELGFPNLIQSKIDSLGLKYKVVNAGLSGETTSGGLNRIDWVLNQDVAVFVLELGANDGLRGIPLQRTKENLQAIIDRVVQKNPDTRILLAGMQIPPNMGPDYTRQFKTIFPDLATENKLALIPFLLEGVAGNPELNLEDGIHPNEAGQRRVAQNVWEALRPMLQGK